MLVLLQFTWLQHTRRKKYTQQLPGVQNPVTRLRMATLRQRQLVPLCVGHNACGMQALPAQASGRKSTTAGSALDERLNDGVDNAGAVCDAFLDIGDGKPDDADVDAQPPQRLRLPLLVHDVRRRLHEW